MDARQLVEAVDKLYPGYAPAEQLRIGLLLSQQCPDLEELSNPVKLQQQCSEIALQLNAASDQHAAVAGELDALATTAPCEFTPDHLWSLVRALKVQSQILNMYLGRASV